MLKKRKVIAITSAVLAGIFCIGAVGFLALNQPQDAPDTLDINDSTAQEVSAAVATELPAVEAMQAERLALVLNGEASANLNASAQATALPDGAQIIFEYAASNESITVDAQGNVTAQAVSASLPFVTITAKYDADGDGVADNSAVLATKKVQVSVTIVAQSIELSMVNVLIYVFPYMGIASDAMELVTSVLPEGATTSYTYSSSDESVATVTDGGIIEAIAEGSATITATSEEGFTADCAVTVSRAPADVSAQEEAEAAAAAAQAAAEAAAAEVAAQAAAEAAAAEAAAQAAVEAAAAAQASYASIDCGAIESAILSQMNALRTSVGVASLSYHALLATAADIRAAEIVGTFSHTRPDGSAYYTTYDACGYTGYRYSGENIAAIYAASYGADANSIATALFQAWYNSAGHYENMVYAAFTQVGIGVYYNAADGYFYASQNFS